MQRWLSLLPCCLHPGHHTSHLPATSLQKNRDKYGRVVGICSLAQSGGQREDLNAWMVQEGQAVAYRCGAVI
jgi:endonuclease YncB( thermonuclease family)